LFVGPAEQPLALEQGFVSANFSKAFACRKAAVSPNPDSTHAEAKVDEEWKMPSPLPVRFAPSMQLNQSATARPTRQSEQAPMAADLQMARQLADEGHLQDAAAICERYLGADTDSAQGWYLLGLIRDASGDAGAVDCYRKALYLKPDHYETLVQMALWLQKNGDSSRARTYKARAERAKRQTGEVHKTRFA
jgi:chemotaxis protein methyltransferase WspC